MKTIFITGATDGIGLETAKLLAAQGLSLIVHGRSEDKLRAAIEQVQAHATGQDVETCLADFSNLKEVERAAEAVSKTGKPIDALINNAGVLKAPSAATSDGLDVRFVVNTLAPYVLVRKLADALAPGARVVNVSSAAQAPVDLSALAGPPCLSDMEAYSQSKLALTMWSVELAREFGGDPSFCSVNPGSLLASKMVKEGFGIAGNDLSIGATVLAEAAVSDKFANSNGRYFDNDAGSFGELHRDATSAEKCRELVAAMDRVLERLEQNA